jgi:hypothetical protein
VSVKSFSQCVCMGPTVVELGRFCSGDGPHRHFSSPFSFAGGRLGPLIMYSSGSRSRVGMQVSGWDVWSPITGIPITFPEDPGMR